MANSDVYKNNEEITSSFKRWAIPFALLLCVILAFFDKVSIAALFSDADFLKVLNLWDFDNNKPVVYAKEYLGMLMTVFLLSYGFSSIFLSFIGDLINPVKLLMGMMITWGAVMLIIGYSNSYNEIIFWRVILGIAEGPLFAVAYTIVKKTFPPKEQGRATLVWVMGTPIGASIGFPITIYILSHFGWRATFYFMSMMTLVVIIIAYLILRTIDFSKQDADGIQKKVPNLSFSQHVAASKTLAVHPLFWLVCFFNIALLSYLWGLNSWLPTYLQETRGLNTKQLGIASSLPFVSMLIGEVLGAFISDRTGKRAIMCAIAVLGAGIGLIMVVYTEGLVLIISAMCISMFFWGLAPPSIFPLLAKVVETKVSATASGILNGVGNLVSALIPLIIGTLAVKFGTMNIGIIMLAIIAVLGGLALIPHIRKKL